MSRRIVTAPFPGMEPPPTGVDPRAREGLEVSLAALHAVGALTDRDTDLEELARMTASLLDSAAGDYFEGRAVTVQCARTHLSVLLELRRSAPQDSRDHVDAELEELVAAIRDAPRPDA